MALVPFNTLAFVKKLRSCGMEDKQAECLADLMVEVFHNALFTQQDSEILKLELVKRMNSMRAELEAKCKCKCT